MLANSTVPAAAAVDVMKLDRYHFQMSPCCRTVLNDSSVGLSMNQVGGAFVVSALGLRAVSIAQAIGTSHSRANAMSTPVQTRLNSFWRWSYAAAVARAALPGGTVLSSVSVVVTVISGTRFLSADDGEPDERHGEDHEEEEHRDRRAVADPQVREALVVDVFQRGDGAEVRASGRHDVDLVEDLEGGDHLEDDDQGGRPAEQGDRDPADLLHRAGAVDRGRLVEIAGDVLQAREVQDEVEPERPPDSGDRHRGHRPARVTQPAGRRDPDRRQPGFSQPERRRVDPDPDQRH